jgi:hypothetical protein
MTRPYRRALLEGVLCGLALATVLMIALWEEYSR